MCNKDPFVAKPKKGAKESNGCEVSGCDRSNIDLIKCNMCGNLVCEDCSGVKIAKLRPLMNQCTTLYFACPNCDALLRDTSDVNVYDTLKGTIEALKEELGTCEKDNDKLTQQVRTMDDHQSSLQLLLEERENSLHETEAKLASLEQNPVAEETRSSPAKIEELINKRFDKIDENIDVLIEKKLAGILPLTTNEATATGDKPLFSSIVGASSAPAAHASAVAKTRNDELVEKQEQDKRINNIVIYGISEETDPDTSLKVKDTNFVKSFLEAIEANVEPKAIIRLGNENAEKKRPVKLIMKTAEDKEQVMKNLNKLKNADTALRGISVRDDYTLEERKLIRAMNEEAKKRNEAEKVTHWKVRGTPKNGLKVVKVTARN